MVELRSCITERSDERAGGPVEVLEVERSERDLVPEVGEEREVDGSTSRRLGELISGDNESATNVAEIGDVVHELLRAVDLGADERQDTEHPETNRRIEGLRCTLGRLGNLQDVLGSLRSTVRSQELVLGVEHRVDFGLCMAHLAICVVDGVGGLGSEQEQDPSRDTRDGQHEPLLGDLENRGALLALLLPVLMRMANAVLVPGPVAVPMPE